MAQASQTQDNFTRVETYAMNLSVLCSFLPGMALMIMAAFSSSSLEFSSMYLLARNHTAKPEKARRLLLLRKGIKSKQQIEGVLEQEQEIHEHSQSRTPEHPTDLVIPNVLLIGSQKAGSTAIADWLFGQNFCKAKVFPEYHEPRYFSKENDFFNRKFRYRRGVGFWSKHYEHCVEDGTTDFILDASTNYPPHASKAYETYQPFPELKQQLKIVYVVREPTAREISLYGHLASVQYHKMTRGNGGEPMSFSEHVDAIVLQDKGSTVLSHYAQYLKEWLTLFDPHQILVLSYEYDVVPGTPAKQKLKEFLNASFAQEEMEGPFPIANVKPSPYKVQEISCEVRDKLEKHHDPWNQEFYHLMEEYQDNRPSMERNPFPKFEQYPCKTYTV